MADETKLTMQETPASAEGFEFIPTRKPLIPNGVLAMLLFVGSELMLFAGLISAFIIVKSSAVGGIWPPPGQPRLPVEQTAFNTVVLLASAVCMYLAHRAWGQGLVAKFRRYIVSAFCLATFFVLFQGYEWVGLHAVIALMVLGFVIRQNMAHRLRSTQLWTAEVFWYFVVGIWPVLYWLVYL